MGERAKVVTAAGKHRPCPKCWKQNHPLNTFCAGCGQTLGKTPVEDLTQTVLLSTAEFSFKDTTPAPSKAKKAKGKRCPECSAETPAEARYCPSCGRAMPAPALDGNTKQLGGFDIDIGRQRSRLAVLNADGSLRRAWPLDKDVVLIG